MVCGNQEFGATIHKTSFHWLFGIRLHSSVAQHPEGQLSPTLMMQNVTQSRYGRELFHLSCAITKTTLPDSPALYQRDISVQCENADDSSAETLTTTLWDGIRDSPGNF